MRHGGGVSKTQMTDFGTENSLHDLSIFSEFFNRLDKPVYTGLTHFMIQKGLTRHNIPTPTDADVGIFFAWDEIHAEL